MYNKKFGQYLRNSMKILCTLTDKKGSCSTDATLMGPCPKDGDEYRLKIAKIAKQRPTIFIMTSLVKRVCSTTKSGH